MFPLLAEEIRAGRNFIIEDQGRTISYIQESQTNPQPKTKILSKWENIQTPTNNMEMSQVIQEMKMLRSEFKAGTSANEISEWINEGRE